VTVEINNLQHVILYEFQRTRKKVMSFGELSVVCARAAPHLPGFFYEDTLAGRKFFVKEIIRHLGHLAESYELVGINWIINGKKIDRVALSTKGAQMLSEMEFTAVERMGDRKAVEVEPG